MPVVLIGLNLAKYVVFISRYLDGGLREPSLEATRTLDEDTTRPMQLTASHVYVPRDVGSEAFAVRPNTSPTRHHHYHFYI